MRFLIRSLLILSLPLCAAVGAVWWWANQPLILKTSPLDFRILAGSSLRSAASQMQEAGIDLQPTLLALVARANKSETGIKAGSYSVSQGVTPIQLLEKLTQGKVSLGQVTLVEGWSFRQWRARMDAHPELIHDTLGLDEAQIIAKLGMDTVGWKAGYIRTPISSTVSPAILNFWHGLSVPCRDGSPLNGQGGQTVCPTKPRMRP